MFAVFVKLTLIALVALGVNLTMDKETVTALNTLLNLGSFYLLIWGQRKLRRDVAPRVEAIEETVTEVIGHRQPGGRRQTDPPKPGEGC